MISPLSPKYPLKDLINRQFAFIWVKVFKNGPSKIFARQLLIKFTLLILENRDPYILILMRIQNPIRRLGWSVFAKIVKGFLNTPSIYS